jgi:O-antigen ligase
MWSLQLPGESHIAHGMNSIILMNLIIYLGTLAATQTVYGGRFMDLRWIALLMLVFISGLNWIIIRSRKGLGLFLDKSSTILLVYFLVTFLTVIEAENPLFSGLRWSSHAMMLLVFLIFLRQNITFNQIQNILVGLKIIIAVMLLLSLLNPAPQTIYDNFRVFRGAMGNANTMGQIAAIGMIIYFHSFLIGRDKRLCYLEGVIACIAGVVIWLSGSRSAMIVGITGIGLIIFFYSKRMKGKVIWTIFLICLLTLTFPTLFSGMKQFILKSDDLSSITLSKQITKSRSAVWSSAWEGFKSRPVFGWGFGTDNSISKDWVIKLTALGAVERDAINDFLFMLEGCGIIGFGAYLLLIYIAWRQKPTPKQVLIFRQLNYNQFNLKDHYLSLSHTHVIMFIIAISLLVLVQFDNTALSAGNFISVILWLSVSVSGAIRKDALSSEIAMYHYLIRPQESVESGLNPQPLSVEKNLSSISDANK